MNESARERLIVALDVPTPEEAERLVDLLGDDILWYKIGYQLAYGGGLPLVRRLSEAGKRVFLDLKLLDIPNTVEQGVRSAANLGAAMLTVHAYPHAMRAAAAAAADSAMTVLGVTVMTALDDSDLREAGYASGAAELTRQRAAQAKEIGLGGIVAAAPQAGELRDILGPDMAIVTPGIRPASGASAPDDQKRVATPAAALASGASHLVVGRPILAACDPAHAARAILAEMEDALAARRG